MSPVIAVMIIYLGLLAAFAIWSRRETGTLKGFYLAGKKLPFWVVAFSTNATGESGWLLLGLTGMGYAVGAQAYWVVVGEILGIWLSWTLISRRLKRLSDAHEAITVPDVLAAKFKDRWHLIRGVAVIIILTMVTTYVTAQMVASGKALNGFVGIDYEIGVVVGSAIIIAYTFVGGHKAVSYTDVMQGLLMLLGLIFVPIVAVNAAGGWDSVMSNLAAQDPKLVSMFSLTEGGVGGWVAAASFVAIGLPFLGVPQLLVRYMSAKDENELRKARWVSVFVLLFFTFGAVTAGIAGRALFPGLEDPEKIFPTLSSELFSPLVAGVLLVIVLAAIMSTADSLLLLASSAIVRDTMQQLLGSKKTDHQLAGYGKIVTILIGIVGIAVAIPDAKFIFDFVLYAWSGLGAAFGPTLICLLYYKKTTWAGVVAGMLSGFVTSIVWVEQFKEQTHDLYEAIPGFIAGLAVTYMVSAMTHKPTTQQSDG
ncbi:MAG: sodium/proline symporter [Gammaproteobacteria bacterium]|nr:sodium/proline symporter [Gammaproteobacteria bacterium]MDH3373771.1 sodium/proline symporter [Gammaproteobacteria bacterium]MDH3410303.1 sodium/proline symporter [Gammaproteobacteria bacterium]MDH3552315.1 sodium/proline symporter [Gammaproteobacteria bacterium]